MKRFVLWSALFLSACTAAPETGGDVVGFNGSFLEIRGVMNQSGPFAPFEPTPGMQAQAEKVCKGPATFQGTAIPENDPTGQLVVYNFLCG